MFYIFFNSAGADGIPGKDGTPGTDGKNGLNGKDGENCLSLLQSCKSQV